MSNFTKKALIDAFVKLLNEKPFDKITIQELVDYCGVNRNTFYYHFQDIYMLLEEVLKQEENAIVQLLEEECNIRKCLQHIIDYMITNKKAICHLYNSMNRETLENYLGHSLDIVLHAYFSIEFKDIFLDNDKLNFILSFYKHGLVGCIMEWISEDFSSVSAEKFIEHLDVYIIQEQLDRIKNDLKSL